MTGRKRKGCNDEVCPKRFFCSSQRGLGDWKIRRHTAVAAPAGGSWSSEQTNWSDVNHDPPGSQTSEQNPCMPGVQGPSSYGEHRGIPVVSPRNLQFSRDVQGVPETSQSQHDHGRGRGRGRSRGRGGFFGDRRKYPMGFKALENLKTLPSDGVVLNLLKEISAFCRLLAEEDISPDKFDLIMQVLSLATNSQSNKESIYELFNIICEQKFIDKLATHAFTIKRCHPDRAKEFFSNAIKFLGSFADAMITIAIDRLPNSLDIILSALRLLKEDNYVSENLVKEYEDLQQRLTEEAKQWEQKNKVDDKVMLKTDMDHLEPPEDFRVISVLPTSFDVTQVHPPFLRKNIVQGKYRDREHYLDVQFRLLREDFVRSLRRGVNDFRSNLKKIRDVRIYRGVTIHEVNLEKRKFLHSVNINQGKKMKFENSKRLMFGNFVCFSKDNFKTLLLGSVADRDPDQLKNGMIGVQFEFDAKCNDLSGKFIMMESKAYFMAYKHVLKALQKMPKNALPMEPYIVHLQTNVKPPTYLNPGTCYDLRVMKNLKMLKVSEALNKLFKIDFQQEAEKPVEDELQGLKEVHVGNDLMMWPTSADLNLDDSQHRALRSALTQQLAIIQGPPGTGKTFLGLKIVQTLLHNSSAWKTKNNQGPILVICYTNHALDQFLEGMTSYTSNIVRIGSRTKSEVIKKFQINSLVRSITMPAPILNRSRHVRWEVSQIQNDLRQCKWMTDECNSISGIISLDILMKEEIIPQHLLIQLQKANHCKKLAYWLLDYRKQHKIHTSQNISVKDRITRDQRMPTQRIPINLRISGTNAAPIVACDEKEEGEIDDIENLLEMVEQDRMLENIDEDIPVPVSVPYIEYEAEEMNFEMEIEELWEEYEQYCDNDVYLRYEYVVELRKALNLGHDIPESPNEMREMEKIMSLNLWNLKFPQRWQMYKYWLRKLERKVARKLEQLNLNLKQKSRAMDEMRNQEVLYVMRHASVVGLTTTGAAQYNSVLQDLAPPIVVIEEAAEILEAHVITSLSADCQHLIMIGDHQQLRPSVTEFQLATKYGLDTSLFERMIKNGMVYETLEYQHRMRPSISKLLVPSVYPELKDHPSVHKYPSIKGISKDVFFITHEVYEKNTTDDNNSRENLHEAEFLIGLCRHLMLQGYSPEEVTILTPYTGQFFLLRKLQREQATCTGVRICVVDNFQGEENKIILLSLVRSNFEGNVGFLRTENRVCVALSRAQHGFYITGNINILSASSELWKKIQDDLTGMASIGSSLTLHCSNHPEQLISVSSGEEFIIKSPEGGCQLVCGKSLPTCKHSCPMLCHLRDIEHRHYKCLVPCPKTLCSLDHQCPRKCWESCKPCQIPVEKLLPCGHTHLIQCHISPENYSCPTKMIKEISHCLHKVTMPCHIDPDSFLCPMDCDTRLDCGHKCRLDCHRTKDPDHLEYRCFEKCTKNNAGCTKNHKCLKKCYEECNACAVSISKEMPCSHIAVCVECSQPVGKIKCKKMCKKVLPCGHPCERICFEGCGGCRFKVKKTVSECHHVVLIECGQPATSDKCTGRCPKILPCGHPCTKTCKDKCTDKCMVLSKSTLCPKGHVIKLPCHLTDIEDEDAWPYCTEPCSVILACEHSCVGDCGRCCQGRLHLSCSSPCKKPLVCGHLCNQPCSVDCPPCQEKCQWSCVHSKCRKLCGAPCLSCKMPCTSKCKHQQCKNFCGDKCSRKPCDMPCMKRLQKCGHPCIGFCGDPCPPLCRECDKEEVTSVLFGFEDEPGSRFVLLEDCGHTIESRGLEGWLEEKNAEIGMKQCPRCRAAIYNNRRYQNVVLETYKAVADVKAKYNVYSNENEVAKMKDIKLVMQDNPAFAKRIAESISTRWPHKKQMSDRESKLCLFQAQVLKKVGSIQKLFKEKKPFMQTSNVAHCKSLEKRMEGKIQPILNRVMENKVLIAPQMMQEISCELQRLMVLPAYWEFQKMMSNSSITKIIKIQAKLENLMNPTVVFDEETEKEVRELLKESLQYFDGLGISDSERVMIVKAMGFKQGHWYKCPKGHIYCISDCGGAVVEDMCPTCKSIIGGRNHKLRSDNVIASEMDGARHSAWSEFNNMGNYNF